MGSKYKNASAHARLCHSVGVWYEGLKHDPLAIQTCVRIAKPNYPTRD